MDGWEMQLLRASLHKYCACTSIIYVAIKHDIDGIDIVGRDDRMCDHE